jgi:hypothetical protein
MLRLMRGLPFANTRGLSTVRQFSFFGYNAYIATLPSIYLKAPQGLPGNRLAWFHHLLGAVFCQDHAFSC